LFHSQRKDDGQTHGEMEKEKMERKRKKERSSGWFDMISSSKTLRNSSSGLGVMPAATVGCGWVWVGVGGGST